MATNSDVQACIYRPLFGVGLCCSVLFVVSFVFFCLFVCFFFVFVSAFACVVVCVLGCVPLVKFGLCGPRRVRPCFLHTGTMAEQTPLSRDTLTGLHKILAVECHDQILAYNEVKGRNHDNPAASVEQGAAVRACYHKT